MNSEYSKVAQLTDIPPGKMKCVVVNSRRVLLANCGGVIYAADESCTHEEASLCLGSLRGEWVKCPLHGSKFNLRTGEVMDEPADTPLRTHDVKVQGHDILVRINP